MSFTGDCERDNFETNKEGWELIREYIPQDKRYGLRFIVMVSKKNILKIWDMTLSMKTRIFLEQKKKAIL